MPLTTDRMEVRYIQQRTTGLHWAGTWLVLGFETLPKRDKGSTLNRSSLGDYCIKYTLMYTLDRGGGQPNPTGTLSVILTGQVGH
jgi:hypothetical protein